VSVVDRTHHTYQELGRIGNNLNQLIRRFYDGFIEEKAIFETLEGLTKIIHAIRREVRGQ